MAYAGEILAGNQTLDTRNSAGEGKLDQHLQSEQIYQVEVDPKVYEKIKNYEVRRIFPWKIWGYKHCLQELQ